MAQWAKRPPQKQEVPGSNPRGWFKRSRWESRPLLLVGNGAGAGTHPIDREGSVFPRGTGRFLVIKGALMYPYPIAVSAMKQPVLNATD